MQLILNEKLKNELNAISKSDKELIDVNAQIKKWKNKYKAAYNRTRLESKSYQEFDGQGWQNRSTTEYVPDPDYFGMEEASKKIDIYTKRANEVLAFIDTRIKHSYELIKNGADINLKNYQGSTIVHNLVLFDKLDYLDKILQFNPKLMEMDNYGNTPLHYSIVKKNLAITSKLLIAGADANIYFDKTHALEYALLNCNDEAAAKELVKYGADPNIKIKGESALNFILKNLSDDSIALELINKGAKIDTIKEIKRVGVCCFASEIELTLSLLQYAISNNKNSVAQKLVKTSDLNQVDNAGKSILQYALKYQKPELAKYMIENGANVNWLDKNKKSVVAYAKGLKDKVARREIVKLLRTKGAEPEKPCIFSCCFGFGKDYTKA